MKLSIVIPAYNCERYIEQAVHSVWDVAPPCSEVIVVDDGSEDATREIAADLSRTSPLPMRVEKHPGRRNCGPGATRNRGIAMAAGTLVAFLDADDYYLPGRFDEDLRQLANEDSLTGVYGLTRIELEGEGSREDIHSDVMFIGLPPEAGSEQTMNYLLKEHFWHANAVTVRRSALLQVGGFDEKLPMAEDCLLWFKLASAGRLSREKSLEPVAVYRRRNGSTHQFGEASKACLLEAMAIATTWARGENISSRNYRQLHQGTLDYFVKIGGAARISRNSCEAQQYFESVFRILRWRVFTEPRAVRLALGILCGRYYNLLMKVNR